MRRPFTRTWPAATSAAASARVRTTRACHSHLSMRWRSKPSVRLLGAGLKLFLKRCEFGERRVRIGLAAGPALAPPLDVFRAQRRLTLRTNRLSAAAIGPRRLAGIPFPGSRSFRTRGMALGPIRMTLALAPLDRVGRALPGGRQRRVLRD